MDAVAFEREKVLVIPGIEEAIDRPPVGADLAALIVRQGDSDDLALRGGPRRI